MFDHAQCEDLKASLMPFSLDRPYESTVSMPLCMQLYMEFYGFFDTVKALDVEYYWGARSLAISSPNGGEFAINSPVDVAVHYWQRADCRACVFLVHGLFDHVGLYQKFVRFLLIQGYSVVAFDLPGHGLSGGASTQVGRFSEYAEVLTQVYQYFQPLLGGVPCFAAGQSTGAAVIMAAVFEAERSKAPPLFKGLVFLAPLVRPKRFLMGRWAFFLLHRIVRQIKRDFSSANSHDQEFQLFLQFHDPLQSKGLSTQWLGAMYDWIERFSDQPKVSTPLLILQGTADRVVDWRFNVGVIQEHFSDSQVRYVKGAKHHLVNEATPWRKVVFSGVGQFLRRPQKAR